MPSIALISDTHGFHWDLDIPACDILLHAGDYGSYGDMKETVDFNQWLGTLDQVKHKIIVAGNHDLFAAKNYNMTKTLFSNADYIQDEMITVERLKIWGSPWSRTFGRWAFMCAEQELLLKYQKIPAGVDIIVSHTPAYGILDHVPNFGGAGSKALLQEVTTRIKPKLLVGGHLHDNNGFQDVNGIKFATACICDEDYRPSREPLFLWL